MVDTLTTNGQLPAFVEVRGAPRFSANQLRQLTAVSGLPTEQLMNNGADVIQAVAYTVLRAQGYEISWEAAGDVPVEFIDESPDPT